MRSKSTSYEKWCKCPQPSIKIQKLQVFPKVRVIQISRVLDPYEPKNLRILKLGETFEEDIDGTDQKVKYELKAIINHHGTESFTGHYTCFAKRDDRWVFFNDEQVSILSDYE